MAVELVVAVLVVVALLFTVRIAPESARFAVLAEGQFRTLKGPGILLKAPRPGVKWVRLAVGDSGRLVSTGLADFKGVQVPVEVSSEGNPSAIQISGFRGSLVIARKTVS